MRASPAGLQSTAARGQCGATLAYFCGAVRAYDIDCGVGSGPRDVTAGLCGYEEHVCGPMWHSQPLSVIVFDNSQIT